MMEKRLVIFLSIVLAKKKIKKGVIKK